MGLKINRLILKKGTKLDTTAIKTVFDQVEQKIQHENYIFRGESQEYNECSSTLYRAYNTRIELRDLSLPSNELYTESNRRTEGEKAAEIKQIEKEIIEDVRNHDLEPELDDINLWSRIQHYGGYTNLIDFTKSFPIAIFFACEKDSEENGRIILQEINSEIEGQMIKSEIPQNRIIAQKSVFVKPPTGVFPIVESVTIPRDLKGDLRRYLKVNFNISTETIYNDLHGYIQHATKKSRGQFLHVHYTTNRKVEKRVLLSKESWNEIEELSQKCVNGHYRNPTAYLTWIIEQHIYLCKNLKGFDKSILPVDTNVEKTGESKERVTVVLKNGQTATQDPEGDPVYMKDFSIERKQK